MTLAAIRPAQEVGQKKKNKFCHFFWRSVSLAQRSSAVERTQYVRNKTSRQSESSSRRAHRCTRRLRSFDPSFSEQHVRRGAGADAPEYSRPGVAEVDLCGWKGRCGKDHDELLPGDPAREAQVRCRQWVPLLCTILSRRTEIAESMRHVTSGRCPRDDLL